MKIQIQNVWRWNRWDIKRQLYSLAWQHGYQVVYYGTVIGRLHMDVYCTVGSSNDDKAEAFRKAVEGLDYGTVSIS